jgi:hypothetical protein
MEFNKLRSLIPPSENKKSDPIIFSLYLILYILKIAEKQIWQKIYSKELLLIFLRSKVLDAKAKFYMN